MIYAKRATTALLALVLALLCFGQRTASGPVQSGDKVRAANLVYAVNKTSTCFSDRFLMRLQQETNINTEPHLNRARLGSDEVFKYPFSVMTGEGSYQLTPKERENLKYYVTHGGFLVASASCSDPQWIQSFREEMKRIFPDNPLRIIPLQHPIYRTVYNIASTATIHGRHGANLEGLFYHNKIVAIFSPDGINDTAHTQGCCCCGGDELNDAEYYNVNALAYALLH